MLRKMSYYNCSAWGKGEPDEYGLQIVDNLHMVFSERASSDTELIKGAKAAGVPIHGKHWADYLTPQNALEKRMRDDVTTLSNIVTKLATVEVLEGLGYSRSDAKRILKDAAYVADSEEDRK
jgi:hypothetical protein